MTDTLPLQTLYRCTLHDGVVVDHRIVSTAEAVTFAITARNPTGEASEAHWAQPCIRVGEFTGTEAADTPDLHAYLAKSFVFLDGKAERLPTRRWAVDTRYVPGQVWCPAHVGRNDVNLLPLSPLVPSNGLIGCFSKDGKLILATAFEPYHIIRRLHSDFRIGGLQPLQPSETKPIRGKLYIVPNDLPALLARYQRDFPERVADASSEA